MIVEREDLFRVDGDSVVVVLESDKRSELVEVSVGTMVLQKAAAHNHHDMAFFGQPVIGPVDPDTDEALSVPKHDVAVQRWRIEYTLRRRL